MNRRGLLRIGSLGAMGLTLSSLFRAEARHEKITGHQPSSRSSIRSCILIFYYGGPSHLDTWDMKPNAPREVRGAFASIPTRVPGLRVCEHMPQAARVMDRLAILRGLHHPMTNHNAAAFTALCGRNPLKGDLELLGNDRNDPPCLGSILDASLPEVQGLPTFVALPHVMYNVVQLPGQIAGFLGSAHNPFQVTADPSAADFHLGELQLPGDVSLSRLNHRAALLQILDQELVRQDALARAVAGLTRGKRLARSRAMSTRKKHFACSVPQWFAARSSSGRKIPGYAIDTAGPSMGKVFFWRVALSKRESGS